MVIDVKRIQISFCFPKYLQVPQYILDDMIESGDGSMGKIVVTQPRRISAMTVAERVANERGEVKTLTNYGLSVFNGALIQ